ncbi:MAG TPA: ABC transporter permease, partial [Patescibacteria group bacterium]|nr:ABC transporter permease [Patescibacteria group bacterium]
RYALRSFLRTPGFTAAAVLSLALGIGANTTIYSLVSALFFQSLPVQDPDRVMALFTSDEKNPGSHPTSFPNFEDFRDKNEVFSGLAAYAGAGVNLSAQTDQPEQIFGMMVSGNYFDILGVRPRLGRTFLPEEDAKPGSGPVVVLSHATWTRRFGADPQVIGREISLNRQRYTVIGVTPEGFRGTFAIGGPELWVPMSMRDQLLSGTYKEWFSDRRFLGVFVLGRLKPAVSITQAEAAMKILARQLEQEYPEPNKGRTVSLLPLSQSTINPNQREMFVRAGQLLMTVVGLVLLIACGNVANLLLGRAASRRKEIAIRLSLGAGRGRLVRQLLTESILLSLMGGAAGLALAFWLRDLLWAFRPPFFQQDDLLLSLNAPVLLFTAALSLGTGILFGLAPAIQASRFELVSAIKNAGATIDGTRRRFNLRSILVVAQVSLSLIGLVSAGLFLVSLRNAQKADLGFSPDALVQLTLDPGAAGYDEPRGREFFRRVLERTQALPGVRAASMAEWLPLTGGNFMRSVFIEGQEPPPGGRGVLVPVNAVETGYFPAIGLPILRGRDFTGTDRAGALKVVVISEAMAKRFWPDKDPLGGRFKFFGETEPVEVVGVVKDTKLNSIGEDPIPTVYYPFQQNYSSRMTLLVHADGDPDAALAAVRSSVRQIDADLPPIGAAAMRDVVGNSLWASRMAAGLLSVFGVLALTLAALGLYGVMAYSVAQRTREIGIRMAIGAHRGDVFALILKQGAVLAGCGVAAGLVIALAAARLVSGLLFGVRPGEPIVYLGTTLLLCGVALLASYLPARRATRVDPLTALRYE